MLATLLGVSGGLTEGQAGSVGYSIAPLLCFLVSGLCVGCLLGLLLFLLFFIINHFVIINYIIVVYYFHTMILIIYHYIII